MRAFYWEAARRRFGDIGARVFVDKFTMNSIDAGFMGWWRHIRPLMTMRVLEFRYEDAVTVFEATFRRVLEFLGLRWEPRVAEFHERACGRFIASPSRGQVARPLYASSAGRWRLCEAEFASIAAMLAPIERALGYDT